MKRIKNCFGILIGMFLFLLFPGVHAENEYQTKKIVSIVYDDSGSMYFPISGSNEGNKRWSYANYALQAYVSLLDEEDHIYITYMSEPNISLEPEEYKTNRQGAIDKIRNNLSSSLTTPLSSVETAYNQLKSLENEDKNTQYWLVIITDGKFEDQNGNYIPNEQVENLIKGYASQPFNNGEFPQIGIFTIGSDAVQLNLNGTDHVEIYNAGENEIFNQLSKIADKTSSRYQFEESKIRHLEDNKIEIISEIPLISMGILSQNSEAILENVSVEGKEKLNIAQNIKIKGPTASDRMMAEGLQGSAILIDNKGKNIPKGKYVFKFSNGIDPKSTKFLYKPALELKFGIYREGQEITNLDNLREGDAIDIVGGIYELGTGNDISMDSLPKEVNVSLKVTENGETIIDQKELTENALTLKEGEIKILAEVVLDGVFNIEKEIVFIPKNPVEYGINFEKTPGMDLNMKDIKDNSESISIGTTMDGIKTTPEQAIDLKPELKLSKEVPHTYEFDENTGNWVFKVKYEWPLFFKMPQGEINLEAKLFNGKTEAIDFNIISGSLMFLIYDMCAYLALIFLICLIIGVYIYFRFVKNPGFSKNTRIYYISCRIVEGRVTTGFTGSSWRKAETQKFLMKVSPFPKYVTIGGIKFYPNGGSIKFKKRSSDRKKLLKKCGPIDTSSAILINSLAFQEFAQMGPDEKERSFSLNSQDAILINEIMLVYYEKKRA